ncbi:MAG TPA: hypothetical protein VLE49_04675 [Anaerolineales bacterium]|nr:hypothetical protein [Anaerolineales bacterium]
MNTKNLLIASAIGALVTTAVVSIPGVNLLVCVVCLPLWGGPLLATWIYKRQNGTMPMNHAITVGIVAGVFAAVLSFLAGLVLGPATSAALMNLLQQYMPAGSAPIAPVSTSPTLGSLFFGLLVNAVFGLIGGLIGGSVFKDKPVSPVPPAPPVA